MFEKKELPIGIEDFKVLIDNNYYYVDKTKFLCENKMIWLIRLVMRTIQPQLDEI
jgi:hypothetical protein